MTRKFLCLATVWLVLAFFVTAPSVQAAQADGSVHDGDFLSKNARQRVEQARKSAGKDLQSEVDSLCRLPALEPMRLQPAQLVVVLPAKPHPVRPAITPNRIFDNLFYFGTTEVGATVIRTSAGFVLIDTLTTSEDAERVLIAGMKREGLDPADIRFVIVTHAHGDHHGGVKVLREHFPRFRVVMSEEDWEFLKKPFHMPDGSMDWAPKPERRPGDIGFRDEYWLKVGDTPFHLVETPGHTPGTLGLIYTIRNGGRTETIAHWGGGSPGSAQFELAPVERFVKAAEHAGATVLWGSHSGPGYWAIKSGPSFHDKLDSLATAVPERSPFVAGRERASRYLQVLLACKRAVAAEQEFRAR